MSHNPAPTSPNTPPFWSGDAIPPEEASWLFLARAPRLILVAGHPGAGKSCLLASQYAHLAAGRSGALGWRFCHSRTLRGWERLGNGLLPWRPSSGPILPRTFDTSLLHLAFKPRTHAGARTVGDRVADVAFADMPGERFAVWADAADRADPLFARAGLTWVVLDLPEVLSARSARSRAVALLDRVVDAHPTRPLALILAKAGLVPDAPRDAADLTAWGPRQASLGRVFAPLARHRAANRTFVVSAFSGSGDYPAADPILSPLDWSLALPRVDATTPEPSRPTGSDVRYYDLFRESRA